VGDEAVSPKEMEGVAGACEALVEAVDWCITKVPASDFCDERGEERSGGGNDEH